MDAMKTSTTLLPFVALLLSSFILEATAKTQREALDQYLMARSSSSWSADKSLFEPGPEQLPMLQHQDGLKEKDRIHKLPGQPPVPFKQYGGYITIDESAGRAFYYYFTEAQDPAKSKVLPLLLWLNGGPGCSSLSGAFEELGPFRVGSDGKTLFKNKFAWNRAANVLFLESPAGVGFSYSNTTSDSVRGGDKKTADDNYIFLLNWLERFPEYKGRDFYIAGESYAGHYVPQLAYNVVHHNRKANKTIINLKGILVGNGVLNDETDERGMYEYWASHALISPQNLKQILKACDLSLLQRTDECNRLTLMAILLVLQIDPFNIYYPRCFDGNLTTIPKPVSIMNIDPCIGSYSHAYFNRQDVQKAIHANVTKIKYEWQSCSAVLLRNWTDSPRTVLPILRELMNNGIRVWIFSGDVDGRVPVTGTQHSLEAMKVPMANPWRSWYLGREVGGFVQPYENNLTFVTVRGAGHQAPSYEPDRSLSLVSHFLANTPLPNH